jgi:8-oxo-dGTP pyrophosphatase MutT (NUDIX family)
MSHINELIDYTVEVFVVNNDKVLLRHHDKYHKWLSVGGHIELNEDPNQAAVREVKEEVGLDVNLVADLKPITTLRDGYAELIPPVFMNRHSINDNHEHTALTYFATSDTQKIKLESESDRWVWLNKEELEAMSGLQPEIKYYATKALEQLKKSKYIDKNFIK